MTATLRPTSRGGCTYPRGLTPTARFALPSFEVNGGVWQPKVCLTATIAVPMVPGRSMNRKRTAPPMGRRSTGPVVRQGQYRLPDDVGRRVRAGHPWVYRDALGGRSVAEATGAVVDLLAGNREL